jgi:hypothetical protein
MRSQTNEDAANLKLTLEKIQNQPHQLRLLIHFE